MAASRLLRAVAAFVILLSFAAGLRKSYWSGCMKAATVICQQIFSILALMIFLLKIISKSASKSSFFRSGVEISGFGATISDAVARSSIVFCNSVSADRIVMAASRLRRTVAAFKFGVRRAQCEVWSVKCEVFFSCEVWSVKEAVRSEKCEVWSVECEVWSVKFQFGVRRAQCEVWSVRFGVWRKQWEVRSVKCEAWSVKCGVWSFSLECEERSVKCEVWSVRFGVWRKQWEVRSVKCGVWSLKFGVGRVQCEVWSVECEDFASSLAEKIKRLSREGHGRDRVSLNYRSFMFGKLPPPACPGLCYIYIYR